MIQIINGPENIVAFRAIGEVTKENYEQIVIPAVEQLINKIDKINFLLFLDTDIENFTFGAWMQDALLGLKNIGKWNKAAIVTESEKIITFTNGFNYVVPGEFKGFKKQDLNEAIIWVSGN